MKTFIEKTEFKAGFIILLTLLVYIPIVQGGFIWDDDLHLTENLLTKEDGLYRSWFTGDQPNYWPVTWTVLWAGWQLWGSNPLGYHVINVFLHAAISLLVWRNLFWLRIPGAWLAALVFAVHPVNVQTAAWVTQAKNLLATFFYLLAVLSYLRFEDERTKLWYFSSLLSFIVAALSKTSVVMLPFVLTLCTWWQRGKISREEIIRILPFFAIGGALGINEIFFQYSAIGEDIVRSDGFLSRFASAGWVVWFYLYKAIIPLNLNFIYPRWVIDSSSVISYLPAFIVIGLFVVLWYHRNNWGKACLFGLGYFVINLFPVMGFFDINFMRFSLVADHWQYTSMIGIIALFVGTAVYLWNRWQGRPQKWGVAIAVCLIGFLSMLTWVRCNIYSNPEALYRDTVEKNPKAWLANANLGNTLTGQGKYEEAVKHYYAALRIEPNHPWILGALGNALAGQKRFDEAIGHFVEALRLDPDFAKAHHAHNDLALALSETGRSEEAKHHFGKAIEIMPDFAEAHANLGRLLAKSGQLSEAVGCFGKAIDSAPDFAEAHYNLGIALALLGRDSEAEKAFSEAVRLKPDFAEGHLNLGCLYARHGQFGEAIRHFSEALRIRPDFAEAKRLLVQAKKGIRATSRQ